MGRWGIGGHPGPQFAQVDDLLTRTRCFTYGELGHLAENGSQKKEDDASLFRSDKTWLQDPRPCSVLWRATITILKPSSKRTKRHFCATQT